MQRVCAYSLTLLVAGASAGCLTRFQQGPYRTMEPPRFRDSAQAQRRNQEGLTHIEQGDYDAAEAAFRAALEADLFYPAAHNNLGLALLHQGRAYEAAWQFQFAAKLAPHSVEPRHNLGTVMERGGRWDEAQDQYRQALELDPDNVEVMGHLARVWIKVGERESEELRDLLKELAFRGEGKDWNTWARQWLIRLDER